MAQRPNRQAVYSIDDGSLTGEALLLTSLDRGSRVSPMDEKISKWIKREAWADHFAHNEREALEIKNSIYDPSVEYAPRLSEDFKRFIYKRNGRMILAAWQYDIQPYPMAYAKHRPVYKKLGKAASRTAGLHVAALEKRAYVHNLDVDPAQQNRGIGSALLHFALDDYRPGSEVVLEVVGPHNHTHQWVESLGFRENTKLRLEAIVMGNVVLEQIRYDGISAAELRSNLDRKVRRQE